MCAIGRSGSNDEARADRLRTACGWLSDGQPQKPALRADSGFLDTETGSNRTQVQLVARFRKIVRLNYPCVP